MTWAREPNPTEYATLIRISGRTLHRVDAGAQVLVGGFFGKPLQIPPNLGSGTYLKGIYQAGNVKPYFDGVALHPYVADAGGMGAADKLRRIMNAHSNRRRRSTDRARMGLARRPEPLGARARRPGK